MLRQSLVRMIARDLQERFDLHLDCRVIDVESTMEQCVQVPENAIARGNVLYDDMVPHCILARRQRPDMEIMDFAEANIR